MAGSAFGSRKSVAELEAMILAAGRLPRQRTTTYESVGDERHAAARRELPVMAPTQVALPLL
jgi:FO synthase